MIADAVADGLMARASRASGITADEGQVAVDEPLAEWETALLTGSEAAAEDVAVEVVAEETAAEVVAEVVAEAEVVADAAPAAE